MPSALQEVTAPSSAPGSPREHASDPHELADSEEPLAAPSGEHHRPHASILSAGAASSAVAGDVRASPHEAMFIREYDRGRVLRNTPITKSEIVAMLSSLIGENQAISKRKARLDPHASTRCDLHAHRDLHTRCSDTHCAVLHAEPVAAAVQLFAGKTAKVGETIDAEHRSYELMLDLQLGVRWSVSKITPTPARATGLTSADFAEKTKARVASSLPRRRW